MKGLENGLELDAICCLDFVRFDYVDNIIIIIYNRRHNFIRTTEKSTKGVIPLVV